MSAPSTTRTSVVLRRNRTPLLLALALVVAIVGLAVVDRDNAQFSGDLDPRNPGPKGAQAVAKVLDERGVDVRIVRGERAFRDATVDKDTTVVVTNPTDLGRSTFAVVRSRAPLAGAMVVVGGSDAVQEAFGLEARSLGDEDLFADCDEPVADGLTIRAPYAAAVVGTGCFAEGDAVALHRPAADRKFWLLLAPDVLSNDHVTEADNAALSLRLLGQHPKVVWYVADPTEVAASDGVTISSLLPHWLYPALWLLLLGTFAMLVWSGRRFGPLVCEPLPVVVRASESTESRGRLYQRARDRGHAATILRRATQRRLAEQLALRSDAPLHEVVPAVAARTGRRTEDLQQLLAPDTVTNDSALADLGRRLLQLEDEVRTR